MRSLWEHPDFVSNRGNRTITLNASILRKAMKISAGVNIQSNLSASGIRDIIKRCLKQ